VPIPPVQLLLTTYRLLLTAYCSLLILSLHTAKQAHDLSRFFTPRCGNLLIEQPVARYFTVGQWRLAICTSVICYLSFATVATVRRNPDQRKRAWFAPVPTAKATGSVLGRQV
jgi:hypothetical protein